MSFPSSSLVQHYRVNSLCLILIWSKCGFSAGIGVHERRGKVLEGIRVIWLRQAMLVCRNHVLNQGNLRLMGLMLL